MRKHYILTVIIFEFEFETSAEVSNSNIWKHTTSCDKAGFSFIILSQLRWPIEFKFSRVCYFCICWDTPSEKTGLWQLPIVSSVFNLPLHTNLKMIPARCQRLHSRRLKLIGYGFFVGMFNFLKSCFIYSDQLIQTVESVWSSFIVGVPRPWIIN